MGDMLEVSKGANRQTLAETSKPFPDLYEASISELQEGLDTGRFTSVDLVKAYLARIDEVNVKGPQLRAIIETNPSALEQAATLDHERSASGSRVPLHGIPIILKDNIATLHSEGMNTTAGSHALLGSIVPRDATVAAKLRAAGAIFLAKANLSEWANYRGIVPSGFSGRGGQCTSAYYPKANPSGSSSGSGVPMSIGLGAASLGSETHGSIVSPSSLGNIVGLKPTVGLASRAGVIPISSHQDTVGPMTRCVADAAILLNAIVGLDARDIYTFAQPSILPDYTKALDRNALKGARIGIPRCFELLDVNTKAAFDEAVEVMKNLGAEIVDPAEFSNAKELREKEYETVVLTSDFKVDVAAYIAGLVEVPTGVKTLADLIVFNNEHAELELIPPYWNDQSRFIQSETTEHGDEYYEAVAADYELGRTRGIDAVLTQYNLDAYIVATDGIASTPPAIAGYPAINVPLGFQPDSVTPTAAEPIVKLAPGMPFGISFIGTAWSEYKLIGYAYAYEQATQNRLKRLAYEAAIPKTQLVDVIGK
ncbi:hypothetical protein JAAARDRAFT_36172 [Jaapia argillacea MUCL 33604]|uniref:Amidase domain-containing protein n=1 Tax=Jaapia argillacea MUCL 33604 TaxID=933084 RepID=A0A067Q252_9AGAM|nr:hypothetical protein JAAARDRAFT_36172 [Jaapia argillacea MUCL 33604]